MKKCCEYCKHYEDDYELYCESCRTNPYGDIVEFKFKNFEYADDIKELIDNSNKWNEKETPKFATYTPAFQSYYSAGDECEILCPKCECSLDEYDWENKPNIKYCPECGQRTYSINEQEEIFRKSKIENPNGIILDWGE